MRRTLEREVSAVVANDNCSGCGACTLIDGDLTMELDGRGYLRPKSRPADNVPVSRREERTRVREFRRACPGVRVTAARPRGATRDEIVGPVLAAWSAWATDPEIRFRGSSGGALTALSAWLVEQTPPPTTVNGCRPQPDDPRRTVSVTISSKEEALAAAGSRYAPVAAGSHSAAIDPSGAFVGKPCEVSAVRALHEERTTEPPLLLSFFCAGTPSQNATDALVSRLAGSEDRESVRDLWYRGRGWPGSFTVVTPDREYSMSYDDSWGRALGPTVQWRCKICPDGVGESGDVSAADFWMADDRGYPSFDEEPGRTALLARTERGRQLVRDAIAAGVLAAEEMDVADLVRMQPLQRTRRSTLSGRLVGALLAGRRVPRFRGFSLVRLGARYPRRTLQSGKGTYRRLRHPVGQ